MCRVFEILIWRSSQSQILSISDIFVMPSESESFGLAGLEAMACQVPVISSNAGGIPEVNIDGKTGFISQIGDVESMAKNALYVLQDENLPTFKTNALARAKEFDLSLGGHAMTDSSAALGTTHRTGLGGRARHVQVQA